MREIVLDIETTGLWVNHGHKIIEVACMELENHLPTGRIFHRYVNPLIGKMPQEAFDIHQIPIEALWHHGPFQTIVNELKLFVRNDPLVVHNISFDLGFINTELHLAGHMPLNNERVDTLSLARKRFVGASNSLDALCRRYGIDLSHRQFHGALIDCALLAAVYLELIGGRQPLFVVPTVRRADPSAAPGAIRALRPYRQHPAISETEKAAFETMLGRLNNPMWRPVKPELLDDEIPF